MAIGPIFGVSPYRSINTLNSVNKLRWTMRDGERCAYPAPPFTDESSVAVSKQEGYV